MLKGVKEALPGAFHPRFKAAIGESELAQTLISQQNEDTTTSKVPKTQFKGIVCKDLVNTFH